MIQKAESKDLYNVNTLYSNLYPSSFVDYWFDEEYDPLQTYLVQEDNRIISSLSAKNGILHLEGKNLGYTLLSQLYINGDYNKSDFAKNMIREVMEELSYQRLIVLAKPEGNEVYKQLGFEPLFTKKNYTIHRNQVPVYLTSGIYDKYNDRDLLNVYTKYITHFNGSKVRDLSDFEKKKEYHKAMGRRVLAFYKGENSCEGYVVYDPTTYPLQIHEFVYLNSVAFMKMLSYLLNIKDSVSLSLIAKENINKMIPTAVGKERSDTWAKITDYSLFNRLYNTNISSIKELMDRSSHGFYFNEPF